MQVFSGIIAAIFSIFFIWMLVRFYKTNPEAFSGKNLNKSFLTMGLLALILIVVIGFIVVLLRG